MGLMSWLRGGDGRKGTDTSTGTSTGAGTGTDASTAAGAGSADSAWSAGPRERVDLAELPPIQRTLGTQDLVIDPSGFQGSLSTRQDPALGTPLGHLVSPDAPTGLVHGITAPAAPVAADRPSPVQRSAERAERVPGGVRSVPLPSPRSLPPSVPVQRVVPGDASAMTSAGESAVAESPVRQLVGEQPLTAAGPTAPGPATPPPSPTSNPSQHPLSSAVPPVQRSVMPSAPGSPRRVPGLGAPLSALPPTAQRQAAADGPGTESGVVPAARSDTADTGGGNGATQVPAAPEPGPEPEPESGGPTAPLLGDSPLLPAASDPAPPTPAPAVQRTSAVPSPSPLAPPPSTDPVAPLLADRPVPLQNVRSGELGAAVQRSAVDGMDGPDGAAPLPPTGTGTAPGSGPGSASPADAVPVRWTSGGEGTASMTAVTPSVPAALQRTVAAPGQGTGAPPTSPPLPALQRRAAGGPPVPRSLNAAPASSVPSAPAFTPAGSVALAAGVAQRAADGSVVFGAPPPAYSSPVVQRETETEEPPPPDPPQEPDPDPEPAPGPTADDRGAPGATASGGPSGPGGREGGAPVVTDELVRALYPPLSRLFKADLRLERERAGFLINTRH
ncbi:hypothetical protein [Streptomyces sp. NPDC015350]|uniref:hypothetical protein n=1 Tax=Streptomyces sp. NPDC015350 TaxID=3364955 RepID=UPI00370097C6